ncbi:MAG: carbohydrate kinase family protein [Candidatus Tyrphobacter sp.]
MLQAEVVAIGGAGVDRVFIAADPVHLATSNPSRMEFSFGGGARNVAENLARLGAKTALCSAIGDDDEGRGLVRALASAGCDVRGIVRRQAERTAQYAAILQPSGELFCGASDTRVLDTITCADLEEWLGVYADARWIFVECNLPANVLHACVARAATAPWHLAVGATSRAKVGALPADLSAIDVLFLSEDELQVLANANARNVVVTRGSRGVLLHKNGTNVEIPAIAAAPVNVTGAGDALAAGTIFGLLADKPLEEAVAIGLRLAHDAVESRSSVPSVGGGR